MNKSTIAFKTTPEKKKEFQKWCKEKKPPVKEADVLRYALETLTQIKF